MITKKDLLELSKMLADQKKERQDFFSNKKILRSRLTGFNHNLWQVTINRLLGEILVREESV